MIEIQIQLPLLYEDADVREAIYKVLPTLLPDELYGFCLRQIAADTSRKPVTSYKAKAFLEVEPAREMGLLKMKKSLRSIRNHSCARLSFMRFLIHALLLSASGLLEFFAH